MTEQSELETLHREVERLLSNRYGLLDSLHKAEAERDALASQVQDLLGSVVDSVTVMCKVRQQALEECLAVIERLSRPYGDVYQVHGRFVTAAPDELRAYHLLEAEIRKLMGDRLPDEQEEIECPSSVK